MWRFCTFKLVGTKLYMRDIVWLHGIGDFTPVCTTELGRIAAYAPEFEKRGAKLLGLSTDSVEDHQGWIKDIESYTVSRLLHFLKTHGGKFCWILKIARPISSA